MRYNKQDLMKVAKELNDVLGLEPPIKYDISIEVLEAKIYEGIELIDFEEGEFTEATQKLINIFIQRKGGKPPLMQDELTEKMHSEFTISEQDEIKHRCWSALEMINNIQDEVQVEYWADSYDVSVADVKKYAKGYYDLKKGKTDE